MNTKKEEEEAEEEEEGEYEEEWKRTRDEGRRFWHPHPQRERRARRKRNNIPAEHTGSKGDPQVNAHRDSNLPHGHVQGVRPRRPQHGLGHGYQK